MTQNSNLMGIGVLGNPSMVIRRKFRWTLAGDLPGGQFKETFVKVSARPNLEPLQEIDYLSTKTFIPNKPQWEQCCVTILDVSNDFDWEIVKSALGEEFNNNFPIKKSRKKYRNIEEPFEISYSKNSIPEPCIKYGFGEFYLKLYDGCGCLMEEWILKHACISAIDLGYEYDFFSYDNCATELTIKYQKSEYINQCKYDFGNPTSTPPLSTSLKSSVKPMGIGMLGSPNLVFR